MNFISIYLPFAKILFEAVRLGEAILKSRFKNWKQQSWGEEVDESIVYIYSEVL